MSKSNGMTLNNLLQKALETLQEAPIGTKATYLSSEEKKWADSLRSALYFIWNTDIARSKIQFEAMRKSITQANKAVPSRGNYEGADLRNVVVTTIQLLELYTFDSFKREFDQKTMKLAFELQQMIEALADSS